MAERRRGDQIPEEVPYDRASESPSQTPRNLQMQVLISRHRFDCGTAEDTLAVINATIQERLQKNCEVSRRAVHSAPGVSHIAPVRAIRTKPRDVLRIRIRRTPRLYGVGETIRSDAKGTPRHPERLEDFLLLEVTKTHAGDPLDNLTG